MSANEDETVTHQSEIDDEARRNRGFITVFEQTTDHDQMEAGDRFLHLGYETKRYYLDDEHEDFRVQAVPLAHIELPEPITQDEFSDLVNSDLGKLALQAFFPEMEPEAVTTEHWEDRRDTEGDA
jgi:hypothetical protein